MKAAQALISGLQINLASRWIHTESMSNGDRIYLLLFQLPFPVEFQDIWSLPDLFSLLHPQHENSAGQMINVEEIFMGWPSELMLFPSAQKNLPRTPSHPCPRPPENISEESVPTSQAQFGSPSKLPEHPGCISVITCIKFHFICSPVSPTGLWVLGQNLVHSYLCVPCPQGQGGYKGCSQWCLLKK